MSEDKGHYRQYIKKRFTAESLDLIGKLNLIIEEYERQGYVLTVRQLYYQGVARDLIPNNKTSYSRIVSIVNDGRMAGLISWAAIEDRGRNLRGLQTYDNPGQVLAAAARSYRKDLWKGQRMRPEVWIEKEALVGVVEGVCNKLRVDFFASKGYNSQSEAWRAGMRFARYIQKGQRPIVFHLGDHDPSGMDMTRDNHDRLSLFAGVPIAVQRLALNMDQVEWYKLPDNYDNRPKPGDSRSEAYIREYGNQGWELDALSPPVISHLIEEAVSGLRDQKLWDAALEEELAERELLQDLAKENSR